MADYEPDEYELEGYQPRGHGAKKVPWFGRASMMFGVLAFGIAFLSFLVAWLALRESRTHVAIDPR